ncbi:hypothetical protein HPB51_023434 [Rhipicephalus microplus]|uniref:Uncharacterized protein n=1 Tax=Rhipicephalus microplus TaxID=6941 RepID=A0A9J6DCT3_RHIMP|nr:hypothetical protein HPB51_023434 [Rhipicephalus microplus]
MTKAWPEIFVKFSLAEIFTAWRDVKTDTVVNCFRKAGFETAELARNWTWGQLWCVQACDWVPSARTQPHHPFLAASMAECPREARHQARLITLLEDTQVWDVLCRLAPPVTTYLDGLAALATDMPIDSLEDVARFAVLCAEAIRWMTETPDYFSCNNLEEFLQALDAVLSSPSLSSLIGLHKHVTWVCSITTAIYHLINHLKGWKSFPVKVMPRKTKGSSPGVARLPLVNSFVRTPPIMWQMNWVPHVSGEWHTVVPPPPADFLLDRDLLQEYIYRVNLLGM